MEAVVAEVAEVEVAVEAVVAEEVEVVEAAGAA